MHEFVTDAKRFRVKPGSDVNLSDWHTRDPELSIGKKQANELLANHVEELRSLQERLYAERTQSLLLIFQGMDAAGKDSAIRNILTGVNPAGIRVHNYDKPSPTEYRQSFLQRHWRDLPDSGYVGVFNRSHYEEVVVVRVFPHLLDLRDGHVTPIHEGFWEGRLQDIRWFEEHLRERNRTRVLKFFLHVSREEQFERIKRRLDDPAKHWKFDSRDLDNRSHWDKYQFAYARAIEATSTANAPWFIVPADRKPVARLIAMELIVKTLAEMNPQFPAPQVDLVQFKKAIHMHDGIT